MLNNPIKLIKTRIKGAVSICEEIRFEAGNFIGKIEEVSCVVKHAEKELDCAGEKFSAAINSAFKKMGELHDSVSSIFSSSSKQTQISDGDQGDDRQLDLFS